MTALAAFETTTIDINEVYSHARKVAYSFNLSREQVEDHVQEAVIKVMEKIDQLKDFPWVKRILLDNMTSKILKENVEKINGKFETEASGNITAHNLVSYAETGVDYVSMGALTYGAVLIDLSLKAI